MDDGVKERRLYWFIGEAERKGRFGRDHSHLDIGIGWLEKMCTKNCSGAGLPKIQRVLKKNEEQRLKN